MVLEAGFSMLSMDADWRILENPLPFLVPLRVRPASGLLVTRHNASGLSTVESPGLGRFEALNHIRLDRSADAQGRGAAASVVAFLHDGVGGQRGNSDSLNSGVLWWRGAKDGGGTGSFELALRIENRTQSAWEQVIFNEELGWGSSVGCCWADNRVRATYFAKSMEDTVINRNVTARHLVDGSDLCVSQELNPVSAKPPPHSRYRWGKTEAVGGVRNDPNTTTLWKITSRGWHADHFNSAWETRVNRCALLENSCPESELQKNS